MTNWPVTGLLAASAAALAVAPALMPATYSAVANTTSESAAQGLQGAWVARLGFVLFGVGVLWLASRGKGTSWGRWARVLHVLFGVSLLAAALFSNRPIAVGVAPDLTEDQLHSVAATLMGFAFAVGVAAAASRDFTSRDSIRWLDAVALVAAVAIPIGMGLWPGLDGLLQRGMFLIAYGWYLAEIWWPRVCRRVTDASGCRALGRRREAQGRVTRQSTRPDTTREHMS